jgi:hypothetical protein
MLVYVCTLRWRVSRMMASRAVVRKNYRLDVTKLERARRALGTTTETETIHRALDLVADEAALIEAFRRLLALGPADIVSVDRSVTARRGPRGGHARR